jgi:hypothetical protein
MRSLPDVSSSRLLGPCLRFTAASLLLAATVAGAESREGVEGSEPRVSGSSTTTSTSTPSTVLGEVYCLVEYTLYDPVEVTSLAIEDGNQTSCRSVVSGARVSREPPSWPSPRKRWLMTDLPAGFRGPSLIFECHEEFHLSGDHPELESNTPRVLGAWRPDGPLAELPVVCPSYMRCSGGSDSPRTRVQRVIDCGDFDGDGTVGASDALGILRTGLLLNQCRRSVCDANRDGVTNATDALIALTAAVGLPAPLHCPGPCAEEATGQPASTATEQAPN